MFICLAGDVFGPGNINYILFLLHRKHLFENYISFAAEQRESQ